MLSATYGNPKALSEDTAHCFTQGKRKVQSHIKTLNFLPLEIDDFVTGVIIIIIIKKIIIIIIIII